MKLPVSQHALLVTALVLLAATVAGLQSSAGQDAAKDSAAGSSKVSQSQEKSKLIEATRVSTEEAARRAAKEKSKKAAKEDSSKKQESKKDSASNVSELRPVEKDDDDSASSAQVSTKDSGKSPIKDVHGSIQGTRGGQTRQAGGDIGASSKSGKTHVYVEGARSKSDTQPPH